MRACPYPQQMMEMNVRGNLLDPRNSPLSITRKPDVSKRIFVPKSVFHVLTDRFCRAVCMDWRTANVIRRGKYVSIKSEDLVKTTALCEEEKQLSSLLYRQLFHYLPEMLKESKWRLIMMKEVEHILTSRWCVSSRRLARVIFLTRAFFIIEFYLKWLNGELDLDEERFRYSMSGQGYQDIFCAVRLETGVYYYQSFLADNFGFPNDSCFSHIAHSIVFNITDIIRGPDLNESFTQFLQLPDVPKEHILSYLSTTDLLSMRLTNREMARRVDRIFKFKSPLTIDRIRFNQLEHEMRGITATLSVPQQRFYNHAEAKFQFSDFTKMLEKFNIQKQLHYLTFYLLKVFKLARFPELTAQVNKYEHDLFLYVLEELPHLQVIKIAFLSSLSSEQLEKAKKAINESEFKIDSINCNVVKLRRCKDAIEEEDESECSPVKRSRTTISSDNNFNREI
ncbi:unnamed protein product [Bursaphelenchus xylophilus]|uniref:(pine wood nematode) hypothetical protein n=1 Tax=Bursaphelenchus xylophilus TaxID=6326 RepID=A0A1I7RT09_BURXY|nr:unnamed protein product [Bursaphelenchus xylophilus]CAG9122692.1 unnamed protein product [Bursaphelenchus xylophilus]